jgi:hypothetical protein
MLERVALHQTRLRTPGLSLDAKGVVLGSKGLLLLPSLDRLVALLAVYTRERSLEDILPSLSISVVRSKLGAREVTFEFAAESSDRMDRFADAARLVGGFTFTGTSRHFVQYRDANAPFGYDAGKLVTDASGYVLYHQTFDQTYEAERKIELRSLLLRLMPFLDPVSEDDPGPRVIVAEPGLGSALVHYFVRSRVEGTLAMAEWPKDSSLSSEPIRRYLFRVPDLPKRMRPLVQRTPGITCFLPAGPGVAVEIGYRHPVALRACPVFAPEGLVLVRARGLEPWLLPRAPDMGAISAFARIEWREAKAADVSAASGTVSPEVVRVPLRMVPSAAPWKRVKGTFIDIDQLPLLRRLVYALSQTAVSRVRVALTPRGLFALAYDGGVEQIPLGQFFVEHTSGIFVAAGYDITPRVDPAVLSRCLGASPANVLFLLPDGTATSIPSASFVPLERLLLDAVPVAEAEPFDFGPMLAEPLIELQLEPIGSRPLRDAGGPDGGPS